MRLSQADHDQVTAAVTAAEAGTDGEIVTVVAAQSDAYHDVALHWAVLAMLLVLALLAAWPALSFWIHARVGDAWAPAGPGELFTIALVLLALTFVFFRILLAWRPLRLILTPPSTKARRVRRRALALFRTAAEKRTRAATGVLLYLSLDEHRAELIADEAIHSKVAPELWGDAMADLVEEVKAGRPGAGMAKAVERIGAVLAEHFPRSSGDQNELPDRLIEL
ncbi:MAG: putative rane protein [Sphingomonadales bacterium]|jgi:putative membrane protein|nr:putative rane protein [Sphingomonadales bacterium]